MRRFPARLGVYAALVLAMSAARPAAADCTCRALGRDFPLGQTICMPTPAGSQFATCGMVLNNTSWILSEQSCALPKTSFFDVTPDRLRAAVARHIFADASFGFGMLPVTSAPVPQAGLSAPSPQASGR